MLRINMFSAATSVPGQGVGSAYTELVKLLQDNFDGEFDITINKWHKTDISHYHTVNFPYYLSTFLPGRGVKIGYVHFLPETLEGSLKLPPIAKQIFYHYLISFYKRMDHIVVVNPTFIPKPITFLEGRLRIFQTLCLKVNSTRCRQLTNLQHEPAII